MSRNRVHTAVHVLNVSQSVATEFLPITLGNAHFLKTLSTFNLFKPYRGGFDTEHSPRTIKDCCVMRLGCTVFWEGSQIVGSQTLAEMIRIELNPKKPFFEIVMYLTKCGGT